jgi:TPR repeat protein
MTDGMALSTGCGIPQDLGNAARHLKMAADQGRPAAQFSSEMALTKAGSGSRMLLSRDSSRERHFELTSV